MRLAPQDREKLTMKDELIAELMKMKKGNK